MKISCSRTYVKFQGCLNFTKAFEIQAHFSVIITTVSSLKMSKPF